MALDKQFKELVLVFKVENTQNSYARCLSTINYFENEVLTSRVSASNFYNFVKHIPESDFIFSVNQRSNGPNDKMENPVNHGEYARIPVPSDRERQFFMDAVNDWLNNKEKLRRPFYHIRVKFNYNSELQNYNDIENLQFLAMLMQQVYITWFDNDFAPDKLKERLSVYLVPHTGVKCDYADDDKNPDTTLYKQASHYLRLIANMHNGVVYGNSLSSKVEAVNFKERSRYSGSFPLLYLENTELSNNYHNIFETSAMVTGDDIRKAFTYRTNDSRPFNKAGDENPHNAIADLILDETRERMLNFLASISENELTEDMPRAEILDIGRERIKRPINLEKENRQTSILESIINAAVDCDRFTFALFGNLLFAKKDDPDESIISTIYATMELARELGDGIRQIVQNSIQHSQYNVCYISFFKIKHTNPSDNYKEQLCVRVTDLHQQKNIKQTFIEKLKKENKLKENDFPKSEDKFLSAKDISIKGLIGEFETEDRYDVLEAWYNFRKKDSAAHIGLSMFNNTLKRCQCTELQIISNASLSLEDNNEYTYNADNVNHSIGSIFIRPNHNIPGTQISFSIPVKMLENRLPVNLVQLENNNAFTEDYSAFAHYLEYNAYNKDLEEYSSESIVDISSLSNLQLTNADLKLNVQDKWKQFWLGLIESGEKMQIHLYDIDSMPALAEYLKERDCCEVFIKGFFAAASVYRIENIIIENEYNPYCLCFENLPVHFIDILQKVSVSLSLMDFSVNLQVFFSCKRVPDNKDDNPQLRQLVILGNCVGHAIQNAYIMSLEHGEKGIDTSYYIRSSQMLSPYKRILETRRISKQAQYVCPFTIFMRSKENDIPQYFEQIKKIANYNLIELEKNKRGYKFKDIHMRLGNKVHANSFYEMAFLFYRTSVANRIAFYILREIKGNLSETKDVIVFYGYASYSQALIFSLKEMLEIYLKNKGINKEVHYATYQYNLQTESDYSDIAERPLDKIKIFSTLKKINEKPMPTSVVQIVPIATTLTTFGKMRAKYIKDREAGGDTIEESNIFANYNVFLVRDEKGNGEVLSEIERNLWEKIDIRKQKVIVRKDKLKELKSAPDIFYIFTGKTEWQRPTECTQCFPDNDVHNEIPLMGTDPTSTVPTFQIYQKEISHSHDFEDAAKENISRLEKLDGCVYYGHFIRGRNHYQYYIDTQEYISKDCIKKQIIDWLKKERKNEDERTRREDKMTPALNIIFSPEHNTNVGFSQLVNAYYFNGTAEIVSVNVDKQFRSNFKCEHDALRQTIERLNDENNYRSSDKGCPVVFYFVDDSIISGGSYHRAKTLLMSLIPEQYRDKYNRSLFSKCFILINRLSLPTQELYVSNPKEDFLSFCNINISNMRKQGDSCVGCKLEREANYLFKRSSTRSLANYWAKKSWDYSPIMFDDIDRIKKFGGEKAFVRMLLTHVIENIILKPDFSKEKLKKIFILILDKSSEPLKCDEDDDGNNINFMEDEETSLIKIAFIALENECQTYAHRPVYLLEHAIKLLARPFLSFKIDVKKHVLSFIIQITDFLLNEKSQDPSGLGGKIKDYFMKLDDEGLLLLNFIQNCLFETLADMKSTYLIRKKTLENAYKFTRKYADKESCELCGYYIRDESCQYIPTEKPTVQKIRPCGNNRVRCFWRNYAIYLNKIIDSGGDETRSLWMEHLFLTGYEHPKQQPVKIPPMKGTFLPLVKSIISNDIPGNTAEWLFNEFCMEIFIQNSRLLYDGIDKACEGTPGIDPDEDSYFNENLKNIRNWNYSWAEINRPDEKEEKASKEKIVIKEEKDFFNFLREKENSLQDTRKKYKRFIFGVIRIIRSKYAIETKSLRVALVTQKGNDEPVDMNDLDFITNHFTSKQQNSKEIARARYMIKQRIMWALDKKLSSDKLKTVYGNSRLIEDGYCLIMSNDSMRNEESSSFNFASDYNSYRKPFFILRFDNIPVRHNFKLDRDAKPIEIVYLYVSFGFEPNECVKEKAAPLLIMRDILSYRNRIMCMLEKDFSSHLMQLYAHKAGENTILKHERTVSHTSTSDDLLPMTLWDKECQVSDCDYEWLLFRNYTNTQIAKLFNRTLLLDGDKYRDQTPKLYLKDEDIDEKESFKKPAKIFKDLWDENDKRVILLEQIIEVKKPNDLDTELLITPNYNQVKGYFNKEYLKCILFDILFTCARFWKKDVDFLSRINSLKEYYNKYKKITHFSNQMNPYDWLRCKILMLRNNNSLVIINPVKITNNNVFNGGKWLNEQIIIQVNNPIDSFDGHMSLFTISKYINANTRKFPNFEYKLFEELPENWKNQIKIQWDTSLKRDETVLDESVWFVSELPIFQGDKQWEK